MQRTSFCLHLDNHRGRVIRLPVFYTNRTTVTGVAHLQYNCAVLCSDHIAFQCDTDYIASIGVCPRLRHCAGNSICRHRCKISPGHPCQFAQRV